MKKLWRYFDPNPLPQDENDCTIRAICAVTAQDWDTVYNWLADTGFELRGMPSSDRVWGALLHYMGFRRYAAPDLYPARYTVRDFCLDHPEGEFFVCPREHVAAVIDGQVWDSWCCLDKTVLFYWAAA